MLLTGWAMTASTSPAPPLATYANCCEIGHNALEFLLDFGQFRPDSGEVQIHSRIVTGPVQAKLFTRLFAAAITQFENAHGPIPEVDDDAVAALFPPAPDFESRARALRAGGARRQSQPQR